MPFKGNRIWIIVTIVFIAVILGAGAVASNSAGRAKPTPTPIPAITQPTEPPPPPTISFTVTSQVGLEKIIYRNQNNGATMTLVNADLPWTISVKYGDTIQLKAYAVSGYRTNSWVFGDKTVLSADSSGYLTLKVTETFVVESRFLMEMQP